MKRIQNIITSLFSDISQLTNAQHEQGSFERLEDKYLLTQEQAEALEILLKANLDNASPIPNTDYTIIESVYFDNSKLNVLKEYLAQNTSRSKMRTRRYAPNGNWGKDIFIEVKAKEDGVSRKSRFQISNTEQSELFMGRTISKTADLSAINKKIEDGKLTKRVKRVNSFIEEMGTVPTCKVTYSRVAYERDSFRVTIDKDIKFESMAGIENGTKEEINAKTGWLGIMRTAQKQFSDRQYILEVKHSGDIPAWMQAFLKENKVQETSFSKYCYGMSFEVSGVLTEKPSKMTLKDSFGIFNSLGSGMPMQATNSSNNIAMQAKK